MPEISAYPPASALTGSEKLVVDQAGVTKTATANQFSLALSGLSTQAAFVPANQAGTTLPSGYALAIITGSVSNPSSVTCPILMPSNPVDQQQYKVGFSGTQWVSYTANTGQSFPSGAPLNAPVSPNSSATFYYDGSGLGGTPGAWYCIGQTPLDFGTWSSASNYSTGSLSSEVQALQQNVAAAAGTPSQITVASSQNPYTLTWALAAPMVPPGAVTVSNGVLSGLGDTSGNGASAGYIGEYQSVIIQSASAVAIATGTPATVVNLWANTVGFTLTGGEWEIDGNVRYTGSPTGLQYVTFGLSAASATLPAANYLTAWPITTFGSVDPTFIVTPRRFLGTGTNNVAAYFCCGAYYTGGSMSVYGFVRARRVR